MCDSCRYAPKLKSAINKKKILHNMGFIFSQGSSDPLSPFLKKMEKRKYDAILTLPPFSLPAFVKVAVEEEIFNFLSFSLLFLCVGGGVTLVNRNKGARGRDTFWTFSRRDVFFALYSVAQKKKERKNDLFGKKRFK